MKHKIFWFLFLFSMSCAAACGFFKKKKETDSGLVGFDERFPSDWTLDRDWEGGSWKVEDL